MNKIFGVGALAVFVAASLTVSASPVGTTLVYNLTDGSACSGGCGTSPFGNITLTQTDAKDVNVSVHINDGFFVQTGGPHETFGFSITGTPAINMTGFSSTKFARDTSFGSAAFNYGVNGPSPSDHCCSTFSFNVALVSGNNLDITDFGHSFEADMFSNQTGNTGEVTGNGNCVSGTACGGSPTPEPISSALVGSGLLSLFFLRRRASK